MIAKALFLVGALLLSSGLAIGQTVYSFQQGAEVTSGGATYSGTQDTFLTGTSGLNLNYGSSGNMVIGNNGNQSRSILKFTDLESFISAADASNITSVSLTLRIGSPPAQNQDVTILVYAIDTANAGWQQGTGSSTLQVGSATWKSLATGTDGNDNAPNRIQWAGGEGLGEPDGGGYGATPIATYLAMDGVDQHVTISLPIALVQGWITNPSSNAGLLFRLANENTFGAVSTLSTSEAVTAIYRPDLEITIAAVPEPSTALLMGGAVAGLVITARKRGTK